MGETLKERLDRLSENEAEANAKVRSDPSRENWDVWDRAANDYRIALSLAYRSGDLIPRDEITRQMAAEWQPIETAYEAGVMTSRARVLLYVPPYGAGSGNWNGLKWNCHFCLNKEAQPTHWAHLYEPPALTAIKESKDE